MHGPFACTVLHGLYLFQDLHIFSSAWKHVLGVLCASSEEERSGQTYEESGEGGQAASEAGTKTEDFGPQVGEAKIMSYKTNLVW